MPPMIYSDLLPGDFYILENSGFWSVVIRNDVVWSAFSSSDGRVVSGNSMDFLLDSRLPHDAIVFRNGHEVL